MRILMRVAAGLAVVSALIFGFAAPSSGESAAVPAAVSCTVPDYLAAHSPGPQTEYGYFEYEAWIASDESQAVLDGLQSFLMSYFGLTEDYGDAEALASGFIGLAADHVAQTVNVVVDPTIVDVGELAPLAAAAVAEDPVTNVPAFKVFVRAGCFSATDLADARSFLDTLTASASAPEWSYYLDAHDSTYHVAISPEVAEAATVITAELGDRATVELEGLTRMGRLNDGEPHWGGAGIRPGSWPAEEGNICTSAFTVFLPNGNRGSVTAAHCFDDGLGINDRNVWSGDERYGGETAGAYDYPSYDMVRIGNGSHTWDNKIHVDPCCPSVRTVVGSGNPPMEVDYICVSGMTSRALCGLEILQRDGVFQGSVHLIKARRGGDIVARSGDSGGPMYNRSGDNGAIARGMIIAGEGGDECNIFVAVAKCKNVWGHRISAVTGHLDVTVDTG